MIELVLLLVFLFIMLYAGGRLYFGARNGELTREDDEDPGISRLERYLAILKLEIAPLLFISAVMLVAIAVFLLFLEWFPDAVLAATLAALALVVFAFSLVKDLSLWRARRFESKLVDAIDLMQAALSSGESPKAALRTAADASRGQVREELNELLRRLDLGLSIERATSRMANLFDTEGVRLFTQVLAAKWNMGGDLLLMLRSINRVIRDRIKLRLKINSQLSGARYSLFFVALIPYILIPFFLWKEPAWVDVLTEHRLGPVFLLSAVLLQVAGFFWMRRILRIES